MCCDVVMEGGCCIVRPGPGLASAGPSPVLVERLQTRALWLLLTTTTSSQSCWSSDVQDRQDSRRRPSEDRQGQQTSCVMTESCQSSQCYQWRDDSCPA